MSWTRPTPRLGERRSSPVGVSPAAASGADPDGEIQLANAGQEQLIATSAHPRCRRLGDCNAEPRTSDRHGMTIAGRPKSTAWDRHAIASFIEAVAAQALGTAMAAGLIYVGAAALGMIQHAPPRTVVLVLLLTAGPLLAAVLVRHRIARHGRVDMRAALLRQVSERMAAGEPMSADDLRLVSLLARQRSAASG
jgi:hypothetical protein